MYRKIMSVDAYSSALKLGVSDEGNVPEVLKLAHDFAVHRNARPMLQV